MKINSNNFIGQYLNLSGLELKDMLIQQELIFIKMDRTNIPESTRSFILREIKFIHFLFFDITTQFTSFYYTITQIKLINYYWPLCQCSNLISLHCVVCSLIYGF
jgi:hypothetical protein